MVCGACGAAALDEQRFCGQCGRPLVASCIECGFDNPPDHRFCGSCGTPLGGPAPDTRSEVPTATERRVVSVLFIDLVGFTAFSEGRDPEEVRGLITEYFDVARDVIERFGGTVDKFIGDAVMAWWGATSSQEDDAERAVRSALEVVDAVASLGERLEVADLAARAGVMTGEVAVGPGGNEKGLLLGDLVNTTSRLQSLARPGTVFIGDVTATLVNRSIDLEPAGRHQVKGKEESVVAWRATRVLSERGGRGRADMLEPPFVGRVSELRLLKDTLIGTGRDRRARLVSLVGQAGIGKSRLIREFSNYVDGLVDDVYWHEGRSPSYGDGLALWALGEMIRGRAGIQETDPPEVTHERLAQAVRTFVREEEVDWVRERLAGLLGVGESAGGERTELFAAARTFFEGVAERGSTVLVFEDLHWADPSLLEFVEELPDWSRNHPIMVVTMARPDLLDRRPDWGSGRPGFSSLYLGPLGESEMAELIAGAVEGIPETAIERIVAAAGGVPLFAVEMLRTLLSDGRLVITESGVSVQDDLSEIDVPSSVQAVISARLDRLPSDERDLARDAAVLGQSFTSEALAAMRDENLDKLERRLADLVRHEILTLVRDPRSPELGQYQWVQGMLREVAYGRIARADRRDLHLRVARYFRDLDDPELAPVAASHFVSASQFAGSDGDPQLREDLVASLEAAIDRARSIHAHEQILSLVELALPVAPPDLAVDLREYAALSAVRLSEGATADRHTEALAALAAELDDEAVLHRSVAIAGRVANAMRRSDSVKQLLVDHIERYPDLAADPYLAWAAVDLARVHLLTGDDDAAAVIADRALAAVEKLDLTEAIADAMITRGTALSASRYHQAMALLRGALALSDEHGLIDTKLRALINIGYSSQDLEETFEATEAAFEESKRIGDRNHASFVAGNLAGGLLYQLRLDEAEAVLTDPVWSPEPSDQIQRRASLADLEARRGNLEQASIHLENARELVGEVDVQAQLSFERVEAVVGLLEGDPVAAFETGVRHFDETPFAQGISVWMAVLGAALLGDLERLHRAREMAETLPPGVFNSPSLRWAEAMVELAGGDVAEGSTHAETLVGWMRERGLVWQELLTLTTTARMLPPDHEARARYRQRIEELTVPAGALGLWEWARSLIDVD